MVINEHSQINERINGTLDTIRFNTLIGFAIGHMVLTVARMVD